MQSDRVTAKVYDFAAEKAKRYEERRKKIQQLTGMVGEPIDLEVLLAPDAPMPKDGTYLVNVAPVPPPYDVVFGPDEIGY